MTEQEIILAISWFQPDERQKLKEAVDDPSSLDATYEGWKIGAEQSIREFRANGHQVKKYSIKVSKLLEWCDENDLKPDGKARSEYVLYLAQKKSQGI